MNDVMPKLDKIQDAVHGLDIKLAKQEGILIVQENNLREHMARTAQNERSIENLDKDLAPIKAHVQKVNGAIWVVGVIAGALTLAFGAFQVGVAVWKLLA